MAQASVTVIGVDLGGGGAGNNQSTGDFAGLYAVGASYRWNELWLGMGTAPIPTNTSLGSLKDSGGVTNAVTFTYLGPAGNAPNNLRCHSEDRNSSIRETRWFYDDYFGNQVTQFRWEINGLVAGRSFDMRFVSTYGGNAATFNVNGTNAPLVSGTTDVYELTGLVANGSGKLAGYFLPPGNWDTAWNAFQIRGDFSQPERTATLLLVH